MQNHRILAPSAAERHDDAILFAIGVHCRQQSRAGRDRLIFSFRGRKIALNKRWQMALDPGARLGPYEILAPIGAGAMGEVYRARDTKLGRQVAIKVLPDEFSRDNVRLARFEREAQLLASLNHTNIATLYGLEESEGHKFLAMELVEGETLAERIASGAIPLEEALPLFKQIAEGLEAAHEKGVIHRDLKPANIKITPEGKAKILDFGLAKAGFAHDVKSESPTVTRRGTETGAILGTAAYMSPEQSRGKAVDKRTDIWAFGCCLYEALTGKVAFLGETVSDTIANILEREPEWQALPGATPGSVRALLRRCLKKDSNERLRDIGDARIEIDEARSEPPGPLSTVPAAAQLPLWRRALPWSIAALMVVVAGMAVWNVIRPSPLVPPTLTHFVVALDSEQQLAVRPMLPIAFSPDGTQLVYAAQPLGDATYSGRTQLYLRRPNEFDARPIPGTEGAQNPFFSPDGRWVGFHANRTLLKVSVAGAAPQKICDASFALLGASWGPDDTIIFGVPAGGLRRVSAAGGIPETLTTPDFAKGEASHGFPHILPNGTHVLFIINTVEGNRVGVLSLESGEWRTLHQLGKGGRTHYLSTGHLVYGQTGSLLAVAFDLEQLEPKGSPVPILEGVLSERWLGYDVSYFALSGNGTLVYVPGGGATAESRLVWVDREGRATPLWNERGIYRHPRLAPDGARLAVTASFDIGADI